MAVEAWMLSGATNQLVVSVFGGYLRVFPISFAEIPPPTKRKFRREKEKKSEKKWGGCGGVPPTLKLWEPLSPTIRLRGCRDRVVVVVVCPVVRVAVVVVEPQPSLILSPVKRSPVKQQQQS